MRVVGRFAEERQRRRDVPARGSPVRAAPRASATTLKDLDDFPTPDDGPEFYVDFGETGPYVAEVGDGRVRDMSLLDRHRDIATARRRRPRRARGGLGGARAQARVGRGQVGVGALRHRRRARGVVPGLRAHRRRGAAPCPSIEVVFLDTQYHFAETLWYVERVRERYDLNLTIMEPLVAPDDLWQTDPDECCAMRKVEPLARALAGKQAWMTGLRRVETPARANAPIVAPRRRPRHREGQPARAVDRRRHRGVQAGPRAARAPARVAGLPVDRLLAVHPAGRRRRRPPCRAAGPGTGKIECGLHGWPTP